MVDSRRRSPRTIIATAAVALVVALMSVVAAPMAAAHGELRTNTPDQRDPQGHLDVMVADRAPLANEHGSCADLLYVVDGEHTVTLDHWNSQGVPSGKTWDLTFEFCRPGDLAPPHPVTLNTLELAVDIFIDSLQQHFVTRDPQTWESSLTDCYAEHGTTYTVPLGIDPGLDLPVYQPIIGFQLMFDQDPLISVVLDDLDSEGLAVLEDFPTDPNPDPYRGFIWVDDQVISASYTAEIIAHELGHRMGYEHEEDGQEAVEGSSLSYAIGRCANPVMHAPEEPETFGFGFEEVDSGHGGEVAQILSF